MASHLLPVISLNEKAIYRLSWHDLDNLLPAKDKPRVLAAYLFAKRIHQGQDRLSGNAWITHSLFVAWFLAKLGFKRSTLEAALLHDVLETGKTNPAELEKQFGSKITGLVRGLTEIRNHTKGPLAIENPAVLENMRRLILASIGDIRVLLIRLVEKFHAALTIDKLPPADQQRQAEKFRRLYAPLAEYISFYYIKRELEDTAFRIANPSEYQKIHQFFIKRRSMRQESLQRAKEQLIQLLEQNNISFKSVFGRRKGIYSAYLKLRRYQEKRGLAQLPKPSEVSDFLGITILAANIENCYSALGVIQASFPYIAKEFDDYISNPKPSGYRALHLPVRIGGRLIEIQIKTPLMHYYNEFGPASHIAYKIQSNRLGKSGDDYSWIKKLARWHGGHFRIKVFENYIYVLTPKRDVIQLPRGATPLDFAARIHSDLLRYCQAAKVNGKMARLKQELKNGDVVEIIKSRKTNAHPDWLLWAKTKDARRLMKKWGLSAFTD